MNVPLWFGVPVGLLVGVLVGLVGTSGAFIIPTLVLVFGEKQLKAQGTALFIALLPIWISPLVPYWRAGNVNWRLGLMLAAGLAIGSFFGARWAQTLPVPVLRRVFALVLITVAVRLLAQR